MYSRVFIILAAICFAQEANCESRVAVARLVSNTVSNPTVSGSVTFKETDAGVHVTGVIIGMDSGKYGFHVHELGDISTCDATGAHFNPDDVDHGGRDHDVRHVGDLGNVEFVGAGVVGGATIDFVDTQITLRGRNSILGRGLVLHEGEDDLGQGGNETSKTTGNAGARVACGVIAIKSPADPWNSATLALPKITVYLVSIFAVLLFCS